MTDEWLKGAKVRQRVQTWIFTKVTAADADAEKDQEDADTDADDSGEEIFEKQLLSGELSLASRGSSRCWEYLHEKWSRTIWRYQPATEKHLLEKWSQVFRRRGVWEMVTTPASLLVHAVSDSGINYSWHFSSGFWAKSFHRQAKKAGFHAPPQFKFPRWRQKPSICVTFLPALHWIVLISSWSSRKESNTKWSWSLKYNHRVSSPRPKVRNSSIPGFCRTIVCMSSRLIYWWRDWKGGWVDRIYQLTDFDGHCRPKWLTRVKTCSLPWLEQPVCRWRRIGQFGAKSIQHQPCITSWSLCRVIEGQKVSDLANNESPWITPSGLVCWPIRMHYHRIKR